MALKFFNGIIIKELKPEDFTHIHTKEPLVINAWRPSQPNGKRPQCVKTYLSKSFGI